MLRLVASPLCVFGGYEVSSGGGGGTFCFVIISALRIHLANVANWLLKGITHPPLVFDKIIHGGLSERRRISQNMSDSV